MNPGDLKRGKGVYSFDTGRHQDKSDDYMTDMEKQKLQKMLNDLGNKTSLPALQRRHHSLPPLPPVAPKGKRSKSCHRTKRKSKAIGTTLKSDGSTPSMKPAPANDIDNDQEVSADNVTEKEKQKLQRDLSNKTSLIVQPRRHQSVVSRRSNVPMVATGQRSKSCHEAKKDTGGRPTLFNTCESKAKTSVTANAGGIHLIDKDDHNKIQQEFCVRERRRHQSLDSRRSTAAPSLQSHRSKSCYNPSKEVNLHCTKVNPWQRNTVLPPLKTATRSVNLDAPDARIQAKKIKIRQTKKSKGRHKKTKAQIELAAAHAAAQKKLEEMRVPPAYLHAYPRIEARWKNNKTKIPRPKDGIRRQSRKSQTSKRHKSKMSSTTPVSTPIPSPALKIEYVPRPKRSGKGSQKARKKNRKRSGNMLKPKRSAPLSPRASHTKVTDNSRSINTTTSSSAVVGRSVSSASILRSHVFSSSDLSLPSPNHPDMKPHVSRSSDPIKPRSTNCPSVGCSIKDKDSRSSFGRSKSVTDVRDKSVASGRQLSMSPSIMRSQSSDASVAVSRRPTIVWDNDTIRSIDIPASPTVSRQSKRSMFVASVKLGHCTDISTNFTTSPSDNRQRKQSVSVGFITPRSVKSEHTISTDRSTYLEVSPRSRPTIEGKTRMLNRSVNEIHSQNADGSQTKNSRISITSRVDTHSAYSVTMKCPTPKMVDARYHKVGITRSDNRISYISSTTGPSSGRNGSSFSNSSTYARPDRTKSDVDLGCINSIYTARST